MLTLANAILSENTQQIVHLLQSGIPVNAIDEYGFTPLIEAAIMNRTDIAELLIQYGAEVKLQDVLGNTALHWAAENNNRALATLLLDRGADPNAYSLAGQPVGVMPFLRNQSAMKTLLRQRGAKLEFIKDYVNTKLMGHLFELVGVGCMVAPNQQIVEVDFEGFVPEATIAMIADSLAQFNRHYAARRLRSFAAINEKIIAALFRADELIRYQQYQINYRNYQKEILALINQEILIIPVCYEGHAITFIHRGDLLVKCDRREDSRLYDNIVVYRIQWMDRFNANLIQQLLYEKLTFDEINDVLPQWLGLVPLVEIPITAQVSGNCSWANVEACIPAILFLFLSEAGQTEDVSKKQALAYFAQWREWNRDRTLNFALQRFRAVNKLRKATLAEIFAAILFQCCTNGGLRENERAEKILAVLLHSDYSYVLKNYVRTYVYEDMGEEGKRFFSLLQRHGYDPRQER